MTAELAHDAVVVGLGESLNRRRDVGDEVSRHGLLNRAIQALLGDFHELGDFGRNLADGNRHGGVAIVAVVNHAEVESNDVAIFEEAFR